MATQQIALMFLLIAANCQRSQAAALAANENAPYFSELCRMIQLATTKLPTMEPLPDLSGFSAAAELVNLSYTAPDALKQIAEKTKANENIDTADTPANKYCKDGKTATCKKLADLLASAEENNQAKTFLTRLKDKKISPDILAMAAEVSKAIVDITALKPDDSLATAVKNVNAALEDKEAEDATAAELKGANDRVTDCGKAQTGDEAPGTIAGKSLAHDALCMCGTAGTANEKNACGIDVEANSAAAFTWGTATTQDKQWKNLKKACTQNDGAAILSSAQIRTATENYLNKLAMGQLSKAYFPWNNRLHRGSTNYGLRPQKGQQQRCMRFLWQAR
ncbi:Trypanosomal VSG domain containing protein, putative [Trypanosoma equiperdum]|uniref:Trypanosomal VSG domain containing protein, putative n=1 Tax=Trypanosoma equiperdum TaxID=5694 RepID=A0A1G4I066_TRYEQ|nr:Trypanosomal VSG domain containing protein, putative [Trypanosoma equiperdum]